MINTFKVCAKISNIIEHGYGVYSVFFILDNKYLRFRPGQFLHLSLDKFDPSSGYWPDSRVFSICSIQKQDHIRIVYSVKGIYTTRMEKELEIGREVWIKFPYGDFIIDTFVNPGDNLVLIAGGTGISPFIPFLKGLTQNSSLSKIWLFYGVRNHALCLFENELQSLVESLVFLSIEIYNQSGADQSKMIHHHDGILSLEMLSIIPDNVLKSSKYFLSGPPQMISYFKNGLEMKLSNSDQIYIDSWE